jgi:hypothetical protein
MTKMERHAHLLRDWKTKRFRASPKCDGCGKPVGTAFFTDEEVCGGSDGPGFYLCERKRCVAKLEKLDVEQRRAIFTEQREQNDKN